MLEDIPDFAAIEAGLAATSTSAVRTVTLLVALFAAAVVCTSSSSSTTTTRAAARTVALLVTNLTAAEAYTIAAASVVAIRGSASIGVEASGAPSIATSVGSAEVVVSTEASGSREAHGVTSEANIVGAISFSLLLGLGSAVLLGVLVARPVLGGHGTLAQLARRVHGHVLLGTRVGVGREARELHSDRTTSHVGCC
jgi:hypothetical protein